MDVSDSRHLKVLEDENAKLRKLVAEAMLGAAMLRDPSGKNWRPLRGAMPWPTPRDNLLALSAAGVRSRERPRRMVRYQHRRAEDVVLRA